MKIHILYKLFILLTVCCFSATAQITFPHKGSLIIIGGGEIPDTIYNLFAQKIGGKDQLIAYIPTATDDEPWIQAGEHLKKFTSRGFTNLKTLHTRDRQKAENPAFYEVIKRAKGIFIGGGD
jgi:cyanophycinase